MLSIFALLNVMFVPIFDVWGGLFPSDIDRNFFEVIEMICEDSYNWNLWVAQLTMSIFIPSLFMFVMCLVGNRGLFITSNIIGIILWFKQIFDYCMEDNGFEDLLDFDDSCIAIGTWIAIVIYILSFFVALNSKKKTEAFTERSANTVFNNSTTSPNVILCKSCGKANDANVQYCADCGNAISSTIEQTVDKDSSTIIRFCPNCGTQIEKSMLFCGKCGNKL